MTKEEAIEVLNEHDINYIYSDKYNRRFYKALDIAIKALKQTLWIPVSEDLPKVNGKYLVTETTTVNGLMGEYIDVKMTLIILYLN